MARCSGWILAIVVDDARVLGEVVLAQPLQLVEADHPVAVGGAVEGDDLRQVGQLGACALQLGDLLVVLGEHDRHSESARM